MKPVKVVLHSHVEGGRNRPLFLVATDMEVPVGPAIGQPMDQPRIAVKPEDDVLILREQRIIVRLAQAVGVLAGGLQLHQIDHVDHPNFKIRQVLAQNGSSRQYLQCGCIAAASHHDVRFDVLVIAGPLPDANAFGAMDDGFVHVEPLREGVFARHDDVDVMPAAQAMIENREQAVRVWRQVNAHNARFLIDDVVEKPGILMGEPVVILLPDMGGEKIVQRGDFPAPGQFRSHLQPLGVLAEHRIDDADESLIAVE